MGRQRVPWQAPRRAHPDLYLFVVAVLITSWLKQMTDLAYLVGSEMGNISDLLVPLCLPWFSQLHRGDYSNTEIAKYLLIRVHILISEVL